VLSASLRRAGRSGFLLSLQARDVGVESPRRRVSMKHRALIVPAAVMLAALSLSTVVAQSPKARSTNSTGAAIPRTHEGHPDMQGYWTNDTVTPLERPPEFGEKAVISAEEAAAYAKKRLDQFLA